MKHEDLIAALHAWDVSFSSSDRELLLRAKLDEKISAAQSGDKSGAEVQTSAQKFASKSAVEGTIVNFASASVATTSSSSMYLELAMVSFSPAATL